MSISSLAPTLHAAPPAGRKPAVSEAEGPVDSCSLEGLQTEPSGVLSERFCSAPGVFQKPFRFGWPSAMRGALYAGNCCALAGITAIPNTIAAICNPIRREKKLPMVESGTQYTPACIPPKPPAKSLLEMISKSGKWEYSELAAFKSF